MLKIEDLVLRTEEDGRFLHGYIRGPVVLFGQERFAEGEERLELLAPKGFEPQQFLKELEEYLEFLADCKEELESFYKKENKELLEEFFDRRLSDDWYRTLEVYSAVVTIAEGGELGAEISAGDCMVEDHLLEIEFEGRRITGMWFDG